MQKILDTNLTVRRDEDSRRHARSFATREEAMENKLEFVPWWSDDSAGDEYHGGIPQMPVPNEKTIEQYMNFKEERKSQGRSSGGKLAHVLQTVVDGYNYDVKFDEVRRGRSPTEERQPRRNKSLPRGMYAGRGQTVNVKDLRVTDEKFTKDWTKDMETDWLDPRKTVKGKRNADNWMQFTPAMKNLVRMTYRTAMTKPITNTEEQAAHFGSHFKHWTALMNDYSMDSDEYWRITERIHIGGLGCISTKPCRYFANAIHCKNEDTCRHLHARDKNFVGGDGEDDRGTRRRRD
jgi:hypothetical protein